MKLRTLVIVCVGPLVWLGCKKSISPEASARDIEVLSQANFHSDQKEKCTEVARFEVVVSPNEESASKTQSVAEIKARNQGARHDATHVILWPESDQPCNTRGELVEDGNELCQVVPATAFECIIGY